MKFCSILLALSIFSTSFSCKSESKSESQSLEAANLSAATKVVDAYYAAFKAADANATKQTLSEIFAKDITLDSILVIESFKAPLKGSEAVMGFALSAAAALKGAKVKGTYISTNDPWTVATLIDLPTPCGPVPQSEYFTIDPATGKIKSIYSNYDPRVLISLASTKSCPK